MQAPEPRHDPGRHLERLPGFRRRFTVRGDAFGRHGHLDGNGVLVGVALAADSDGRLHARAPDRLCQDVEAHFARSPGVHLHDTASLARDLHNLGIQAPHRHDRRAGLLQLARDDGTEERLVAASEKARKRRLEHHRLVDADLALP